MAGTNPVPDAPDADVLEQQQAVDGTRERPLSDEPVSKDIEAPEADALEQAQTVSESDDDDF